MTDQVRNRLEQTIRVTPNADALNLVRDLVNEYDTALREQSGEAGMEFSNLLGRIPHIWIGAMEDITKITDIRKALESLKEVAVTNSDDEAITELANGMSTLDAKSSSLDNLRNLIQESGLPGDLIAAKLLLASTYIPQLLKEPLVIQGAEFGLREGPGIIGREKSVIATMPPEKSDLIDFGNRIVKGYQQGMQELPGLIDKIKANQTSRPIQ